MTQIATRSGAHTRSYSKAKTRRLPLSKERARSSEPLQPPSLAEAWRLAGLPGDAPVAGKACRCPFHDDHSPSFAVFNDGDRERWQCYAGCGYGDGFDLIAHARQCDVADVLREFREDSRISRPRLPAKRFVRKPKPDDRLQKRRSWPRFIETYRESRGGIQTLAYLRGLDPADIAECWFRGLVRFGDYRGFPCWFILDDTRQVAQARRLNGEPFANGAKSLTLPGSLAKWPVGIELATKWPGIVLVEGGADMLAAQEALNLLGLTSRFVPICLLGAAMRIDREVLPLFAGRRVHVVTDFDDAGLKALAQWIEQLAPVAKRVTGSIPQRRGEDLNDVVIRGDIPEIKRLFREIL